MPFTFKNILPNLFNDTAVIGDGNDVILVPANDKRISVRIFNNGAGACVYGGAGLLGATGYPLPAGEERIERDWRGEIRVLSLSGSNDVRAIEFAEDV